MVHGVTVLERERELKQTGNPATITPSYANPGGRSASFARRAGYIRPQAASLPYRIEARAVRIVSRRGEAAKRATAVSEAVISGLQSQPWARSQRMVSI